MPEENAPAPVITVVRGSLLDQDVEYIVNAANTMMRGGGGIDGLIHQRAGPKLLLELYKVAPQGCATGEAVLTGAHNLKHKGIVHTPGPRWRDGKHGEPELLASSYTNSLNVVHEARGASIGFCSISTGAYHFPIHLAAPIALAAVRGWFAEIETTSIQEVVFAMYGETEYGAYLKALQAELG